MISRVVDSVVHFLLSTLFLVLFEVVNGNTAALFLTLISLLVGGALFGLLGIAIAYVLLGMCMTIEDMWG